jgi:thioredoxin 1
MATVDLTSDTFETTILEGDNDIVLVDWWADWCGPCKGFAPVYGAASEKNPDITFAKIDTDAEQQLSGMAGIRSIPTLMAFREGVLVFSQAGALPAPALDQVIDAVRALDMEKVHAEVAAAREASDAPVEG